MICAVFNKTKNILIADKIEIAKTPFSRMKGLLFKKSISRNEGMLFYNTSSIHTFFMQFPIDVAFVNKERKIIKIYHSLYPNRLAFSLFSYFTLELAAGILKETQAQQGDTIEWKIISPS